MDQSELQRRLEEKVADMVASAVDADNAATSFESPFLPSNVWKQWSTCGEDAGDKVSDMSGLSYCVLVIGGYLSSGIARLERARMQRFQRAPFFPTQGSSGPPQRVLHILLLRHCR